MENTKIKIQIKSWLGKILFEYEKENNTIKETLRNAVLSNADLRNADLSGADLSGAYLRNAVLSGAVLSGADLSGADLSGAYLRNAVLSGADLSGADLSGAVLSNADLRNAVLRSAVLSGAYLPIYCKWSVYGKEGNIGIGCKVKSIKEWDVFFSENCTEVFDTKRDTEDFKRIKANYFAMKIYLETLK